MKIEEPNKEIGFIYLNHEERKIEKIVFIDEPLMADIFIGIDEENYNYLKLENIMKHFMTCNDKNLKLITEYIKKNAFLFELNPSLSIYVETLE